ncbi:MAG: hypothetical protein NTV86_15310, partial [Planctomycetota bacterium]|nr:hypothetical protein [Planctomycetota bacterium]
MTTNWSTVSPVLGSLLVFACLGAGVCCTAAAGPLVPYIADVKDAGGALALAPSARIVADDASLTPLAGVLADEIAQLTGRRPAVAQGPAAPGDIELALDKALVGEAYRLTVSDKAVVSAGAYAGAAAGTATLLQLLDARANPPPL